MCGVIFRVRPDHIIKHLFPLQVGSYSGASGTKPTPTLEMTQNHIRAGLGPGSGPRPVRRLFLGPQGSGWVSPLGAQPETSLRHCSCIPPLAWIVQVGFWGTSGPTHEDITIMVRQLSNRSSVISIGKVARTSHFSDRFGFERFYSCRACENPSSDPAVLE